MTQLDVYNELNIHVARLETCKANPTVSTMGSICAYFGISLTEFYKRVEAEA